jgi:3'(2'), 5'-bisphosphate nucleotidase
MIHWSLIIRIYLPSILFCATSKHILFVAAFTFRTSPTTGTQISSRCATTMPQQLPTTHNDTTSAASGSNVKVNLLDLASACVACAEAASRVIKAIAEPQDQSHEGDDNGDPPSTSLQKNTRLKEDGSFVTDADFAAQGIIVKAIRSISPHVRIVGEESAEEMARHSGKYHQYNINDDVILQRTQEELRLRYHRKVIHPMPLAQGSTTTKPVQNNHNPSDGTDQVVTEFLQGVRDPDECYMDASRVGVVVDPLDGTKSYAQGDYDAVSVLISIIVDNEPYFGVIGKPFGYPEGANLTSVLDRGCVIVYGGPLIQGVYIAGGREIVASPLPVVAANESDLPCAVISSSRSMGEVQEFCAHLAAQHLIHKEPILISGAGEKSLRLILQVNNEALWFFPKKGTSLWDVAAPDAILRSLGGKLTDKFGNTMDYSKAREDAENMEGVVACIDANLHAKCIKLYRQGDWATRVYDS